ncbi:unnamed protein product, partial [Lymnaea stagnalis]
MYKINNLTNYYLFQRHVTGKSLDKYIIDGAPRAEMFDFIHVMPEGEVMVMTEFDLLLSLNQYKRLHTRTNRTKRKARRDLTTRWTNCVVHYEITKTINSSSDVRVIEDAIEEWETYTRLTFKESNTSPQRIQFTDGGGCYSMLGMQDKPQPVVLAPGCRTKGVVVHEIGHAVGWIHEHMRPDRDDFIFVNLSLIPSSQWQNYRKYDTGEIDPYGVRYDYLSIMHYGSTLPGYITTLDREYQDRIGQRHGLTFKDIKLANVMYDCPDVKGCPRKSCPHNGFVFHEPFKGEPRCQCWCDSGDVEDPLVLCSLIDREPPGPNPVSRGITALQDTPCQDVRDDCQEMKADGNCMARLELMMNWCSKTCGFCGKGEELCMDHEMSCHLLAAAGQCMDEGLRSTMISLCPASCGLCGAVTDPCAIQNELLGS